MHYKGILSVCYNAFDAFKVKKSLHLKLVVCNVFQYLILSKGVTMNRWLQLFMRSYNAL